MKLDQPVCRIVCFRRARKTKHFGLSANILEYACAAAEIILKRSNLAKGVNILTTSGATACSIFFCERTLFRREDGSMCTMVLAVPDLLYRLAC